VNSERRRAGGPDLGPYGAYHRGDSPVSRDHRKAGRDRGQRQSRPGLGRRGFLGIGIAAAVTVTDFPDWQAPSAHAAQIASQGVPLLVKSQGVLFAPAQVIGAGGTYTSGNLVVTQPGFEAVVIAKIPNTATVPFVRVRLTWVDSSSSQIVAETIWIQPASTVAPGWQCMARGPSKADLVQVAVTNLETVQSVTALICVLANSRIYPGDVLVNDTFQDSSAVVPTWTLAPNSPLTEVLGQVSNQSIGASGQQTWLIPPGNGGKGVLTMNTGASAVSNVRVNLYPVPSSQFSSNPPLVPGLPAASDFASEFIVPRAPMSLTVANLGTAAISNSWTLVQES
jgi:hypothetical protein